MLPGLVQKFGFTKKVFITFCICFSTFVYFTFYTIFGDKGIIKYFQLHEKMQEKDLIKSELYNQIQNKQNLVNGMSVKSLDLDLLDEQARKNLGYAGKNEVVIYNNKDHKTDNK